MKNLLKATLSIVAVCSTFSVSNIYAQNEKELINNEIEITVNKMNEYIDEIKEIQRELKNYIGNGKYNYIYDDVQSFTEYLEEYIVSLTSQMQYLRNIISDLQSYTGKLDRRTSNELQRYIDKYYEVMKLVKEEVL